MELHLRLNHTHNTTNVSFLIQLFFCRLPTFGMTGHPASATSLPSFALSQRTVAGACALVPAHVVFHSHLPRYQHWQTDLATVKVLQRPVQHPLDVRSYSVVDEPKLSCG
jgi:hypothetical protein